MANIAAVKKAKRMKDPNAAPRVKKPFKIRVLLGLKNAVAATQRASMIPDLKDRASALSKSIGELLHAAITVIPSDFAPMHDGRVRATSFAAGSHVKLKTEMFSPRTGTTTKLTQYDWILGYPAANEIFTVDTISAEHGMAVLRTDSGKQLTVKISHIGELVT
jgi:hypothetical protein